LVNEETYSEGNMNIDIEKTGTTHKEKRQAYYPPLREQLDALYKDIEAGTLTSSGAFATVIRKVKEKYPKE